MGQAHRFAMPAGGDAKRPLQDAWRHQYGPADRGRPRALHRRADEARSTECGRSGPGGPAGASTISGRGAASPVGDDPIPWPERPHLPSDGSHAAGIALPVPWSVRPLDAPRSDGSRTKTRTLGRTVCGTRARTGRRASDTLLPIVYHHSARIRPTGGFLCPAPAVCDTVPAISCPNARNAMPRAPCRSSCRCSRTLPR